MLISEIRDLIDKKILDLEKRKDLKQKLVEGKIRETKDWNLALNLSSPSVSIYGLRLENLRLKLSQKNRTLEIDPLSARVYGGTLNAKVTSNFNTQTPLYNTKFTLSGVNLAQLKADTQLKDKDLSGILNIQADMQGGFKKLDDLKGGGFISIKDADLWQLDLFKGISQLIFLPAEEKTVFNNVYGDFVFENKKIRTDNLFFDSKNFDLLCRGEIGFDQSLRLILNAQVGKELLKDSINLRRLVANAYANLLNIELKGTLQAPVFYISRLEKAKFREIRGFFSNR